MKINNLPESYTNKAIVESIVDRYLASEYSGYIEEINLMVMDISTLADRYVPIMLVVNNFSEACEKLIPLTDEIDNEYIEPVEVVTAIEGCFGKTPGINLWKRNKEF